MAERAGDEGLPVMRIDGNSSEAELLAPWNGTLGRDVGPRAGLQVELPDCAVGHARRARRGAVGDVERSVSGERGARGAILHWCTGDWLPGFAAVGGNEEVGPVHERDANVNGLRGGVLFVRSSGRNESDEDNIVAANGHALPVLFGCFARDGSGRGRRGLGDVGKAGDADPGNAAIARAPKAIVARA
jgi:hypothetical protein